MLKLFFQYLLITILLIGNGSSARVKRIVGGVPAAIPPEDDPVVYVRHGGKSARVEGIRHPLEYHYHFRGLRFGLPPTGKHRFQRPRQFVLEGDVNATRYPSPCLQPVPGSDKLVGSEDCLFLNVFTPDLPDGTEGLPVIVWIHGGGFRYGSASQYGVQNLVNKRVVLVTIQYRLGTLGFLSSGTRDLPGNDGLFDMVLAVQWVRNYIGFFGGNPFRIVVMGHGTGASGAVLSCLSNIAKGLTSAVVAMSGTAVSHWAVDETPNAKNFAYVVAERHGCPTASVVTMISCLRATAAEDIIKGDSEEENQQMMNKGFVGGLSGLLTPSPVSEGRNDGRSLPGFLELKPLEALTKGLIPDIPLLTGVTRDETGHAINGPFKQEILRKLGTIPNFLDKVLVETLQKNTVLGQISDSINQSLSLLDPLQFRTYFKVGKNNIGQAFSKICEATSDALFNLPAFLTADLWSKKSKSTFLYRFEHFGKVSKGRHFLPGFPLVGNKSTDNDESIIGHGDDLGYLFTPQHIDGTPVETDTQETEGDKKVRIFFTDMIYQFAKFGKIQYKNKTVPNFSESSSYIGISSNPKLENNFRFCQIGLWAGLTDRLKTSSCQFLSAVTQGVQTVENILFSTVNSTFSNSPLQAVNTNPQRIAGQLQDNIMTVFSPKNPTSLVEPVQKISGPINAKNLQGMLLTGTRPRVRSESPLPSSGKKESALDLTNIFG